MKVYTKTGDEGNTALLGGSRVSKGNIRIHAYGSVDELNSFVGLLRDQEINRRRISQLVEIQKKLFTIGSNLAVEPGKSNKFKLPEISQKDIDLIEEWIDMADALLPPLKNFILPGGHHSVSYCHIARVVCRRAERYVIELNELEKVDSLILKFLNRLSDYFFVLSRLMSRELGIEEVPWEAT